MHKHPLMLSHSWCLHGTVCLYMYCSTCTAVYVLGVLTKLSSHGQSLDQPHDGQQGRCSNASLGVGRQAADDHGRHSHQDDGDQEAEAAPPGVPHVTEDQRTNGTGDEANCSANQGGVGGTEGAAQAQ